jgi:hypothetical protein
MQQKKGQQNNRMLVHARIAALAAVLLGGVAQARTNPEYDDCLLQHLKNAHLDAVTQIITQACYQNYVDDNFTKKRDIKRNECLLENLPGIESMEAVVRVNEVCDRKSKEK